MLLSTLKQTLQIFRQKRLGTSLGQHFLRADYLKITPWMGCKRSFVFKQGIKRIEAGSRLEGKYGLYPLNGTMHHHLQNSLPHPPPSGPSTAGTINRPVTAKLTVGSAKGVR
jgi:hypothetical protein